MPQEKKAGRKLLHVDAPSHAEWNRDPVCATSACVCVDHTRVVCIRNWGWQLVVLALVLVPGLVGESGTLYLINCIAQILMIGVKA